ncbi:MAG: universal stress protein [Planctomycetota bacterium]|nr:MAG: universal stress protein [Planctomycetota bacterium]
MLDERALNEFESVFEAAVRPRVRLAPVRWARILVALDGSPASASGIALGELLAQRKDAALHFLATRSLAPGEDAARAAETLEAEQTTAVAQAKQKELKVSGSAALAPPGDAILAELRAAPTSLLVIPTPFGGQTPDATSLGSTVDHLLRASDCPALLLKHPVLRPEDVFRRVLAYVPSGFEVGPHFSIPFDLVEPNGTLELIHVVNEREIARYAAAFEVTADGDDERAKTQSMVEGIERRMTALLDAALREVRNEPFTCRSVVVHGDPLERVASHVLDFEASLLVVESESRPETPVTPEAYHLLKEITGIPLLAL